MLVTVLRGAFTGVLFKRFAEVAEIIKTAFVTNLINTHRLFCQKL